MKKYIVFLLSFIAIFLIGASGVSADSLLTIDDEETAESVIDSLDLDNSGLYGSSNHVTSKPYAIAYWDSNSHNIWIFRSSNEFGYNENTYNLINFPNDTNTYFYSIRGNVSMGANNIPVYNVTQYYPEFSGTASGTLNFGSNGHIKKANFTIFNQNGVSFYPPPAETPKMFPGITEAILKLVIQIVIGLIPLVIGLVVFCLALRKGLQLLLKTLRQA